MIYLLLIAFGFIFLEQLGLDKLSAKSSTLGWSGFFSVAATVFILTGAIWTAFGVMLSSSAKSKLSEISLDKYIEYKVNLLSAAQPQPQPQPDDPIKELANAFIVASNFATPGLFFIALGSSILVIKEFFPS